MKNKMQPQVRFSGFTDAWVEKKLNVMCKYHSSSLTAKNVNKNAGFNLYNTNGAIGRTRILLKDTIFIGTIGALTPADSNLKSCLCAMIPDIYFRNYGKNMYCLPTLPKQSLIGTLFSNLDRLISLQGQRLAQIETYKHALLQKMFS